MKQIVIDRYNAVVGYCTGAGTIKNGINVNEIPDGFVSGKYKFVDDEYVLNPDYDPAKIYDSETGMFVDPPEPEPTFEEQQLEFNLDTDYRVTCLELGV